MRDGMQRQITPEERAAIAQRHGCTCDVQTVTVCPPCQSTPWDEIRDRWTVQAKRGRDSANSKKGKRNE